MITCRRNLFSGFSVVFAPALALSLLLGGVSGSTNIANAETRYVKPSAEVVVRRGQGNDYKIVSMVTDGTSVELLEENESYSLVKLPNGKEGWMLKRFLSADPPLEEIVEMLRAEKEEMKIKEVETEQKLQELVDSLTRTQAELKESIGLRDKITKDLDDLRRDTADVVGIKNNLIKIEEENKILAQQLAVAEKENSNLKNDRAVNWFLAGAGVLFAGVIVGRMPKPTRRRKSSLLS